MNTFIFIVGPVLVLLWAANEIAEEEERQCEKRRRR